MVKFMVSGIKAVLFGCAVFAVAYFVANTGLLGRLLGRYQEAVKPPIVVEFRHSAQFWKEPKEYVMQLSNKDGQTGIEIEIVRDGRSENVYRKYLGPGERGKSFGELEIGHNFVGGDTGYVRVIGYDLVLKYDLTEMDSKNRFTYGFGRVED